MSWFEEQLRYREETDNSNFSDAIDSIASAVMGTRLRDALSRNEIAGSAIEAILNYYNCKEHLESLPPQIDTVDKQIEYRMQPFGIKNRKVVLDGDWYHNAVGAMLGTSKEDGSAVALIPGDFSGYRIVDLATGKKIKVNRRTAALLDDEAVCFYQPLPQRPLSVKDLLLFMLHQLNWSDILTFFVLMALGTALGMLTPLFTKWLFSDVLESGSVQILFALAIFMLCFTVAQMLFGSFQALINSRMGIKQDMAVEAAVMSRILSLRPTFFRQYSAGELSQRSGYIQSLCSTLFNVIGMTGFTSVFSLVYIGQIFAFAPAMVVPSFLITLATLLLSLATTFSQMKITRKKMKIAAKTSGLTYATITGIQKIKLTGAEKRMFSRWARQYSKEARLEYNPPTFLKMSTTLNMALGLLGTLVLYAVAIGNHVSVSDYYAFNSAYAMVSSAFMSVGSIAVTVANIKPTLEMAKPIMDAEPESHERKERATGLRGEIELSHVSFKYNDDMPNVIDNLSLKIHKGEYLAIVGSTGCGKSTLMRLLMGFEFPQKGTIFYDRMNITNIDLESLRKQIGVVLQDGKLFLGDIFSNITITAPELTMDQAWEAAEIASIADDIRNMPMGMNTMVAEGQGGISGGQRQRLMIARAIAPKPKILMFDEATSALDNITQRKISEAIDALKCTRIIIAHRLSTIQHADRIVFLDKGKIVEEGTYEELIALNGHFAKLVERQRLDIEE